MNIFNWTVVVLTVMFCGGLIIYVSVPDYPIDAKPWAIQLWGEGSQWWSEVSWILAFGAGVIIVLFTRNHIKTFLNKELQAIYYITELMVVCVWMIISLCFVNYYYSGWQGFEDTVLKDREGVLHGLFYLGTTCLIALSTIRVGVIQHEVLRRLNKKEEME